MKRLLLLVSILFVSYLSHGQVEANKQTSNLIIALDRRPGRVLRAEYWNAYSISNAIKKLTRKAGIEPDYVSGVLYGHPAGDLTPKNFSELIEKPNAFEGNYQRVLNKLYNGINRTGETYFSITSFAKPFCLVSLRGQQNVNRTFLAIVSDFHYNGNDDYYGEIKYAHADYNSQGKEEFKNIVKNVQTNYFCEFIGEASIDVGYVQLYEYVPLQQYFTLESVLDFPHTIIAHRQKDCYTVKFSISNIGNKDYEIQKLILVQSMYGQVVDTMAIDQNKEIVINIEKKDIDSTKLEIKSWVRLCDNVYDNTILHPNGSKLQGSEGLTRTIIVEKEPKAKILGLFPLTDFMFYLSFWTSSQTTAATTWSWILILIVIAIIIVVIRNSNIYKPHKGETKI